MPMADRYPSWAVVTRMIDEGVPQRIRVLGTPSVEILLEPGGQRMGLLIPYEEGVESLNHSFTYIDVTPKTIDGSKYLFISTSEPGLYAEFFSFMTGVADEIQLYNRSSVEAVDRQFGDWRTLLARQAYLGPEEEIGLYGELWTLTKTLQLWGTRGLDAWTGPLSEPHDFRFERFDLEVKATRNRARLHRVSSLEQLVPAVGKSLYLLSLQFQPGGLGGESLPEVIDSVRHILASDLVRQSRFESMLVDHYGLDPASSGRYTSRFELRTCPVIIPVNSCPQLTPEKVAAITDISRVSFVQYSIDVEGLGYEHGTPEFSALLPFE